MSCPLVPSYDYRRRYYHHHHHHYHCNYLWNEGRKGMKEGRGEIKEE
jgi:hypothetical protein